MSKQRHVPMTWTLGWLLLVFGISSSSLFAAAAGWRVQIEEPTGLYPRTNELVTVAYTTIGQINLPVLITDNQGVEVPWQATSNALLFPATLIHRLIQCLMPAPGQALQ